MVYDERSNYVGDTHWRDEGQLDDGDEIELERGGILVQVADCIGRREQDLSGLLDKRLRDREERAAVKSSGTKSSPLRAASHPSHLQLSSATRFPETLIRVPEHSKPKSLNALLGAPSGHHGRARLPTMSPYENRQKSIAADHSPSNRPSKRPKINSSPPRSGYAEALTGATLNLSTRPSAAHLRLDPRLSHRSRIVHDTVELVDLSEADRGHPQHALPSARDGTSTHKSFRQSSPVRTGYAQNITGATLTLSGRPASIRPSLRPEHEDTITVTDAVAQSIPKTQEHQTIETPDFLDISVYEKVATSNRRGVATFLSHQPKDQILGCNQKNPDDPGRVEEPISDSTLDSFHTRRYSDDDGKDEVCGPNSATLRIVSKPKNRMLFMAQKSSLALARVSGPSTVKSINSSQCESDITPCPNPTQEQNETILVGSGIGGEAHSESTGISHNEIDVLLSRPNPPPHTRQIDLNFESYKGLVGQRQLKNVKSKEQPQTLVGKLLATGKRSIKLSNEPRANPSTTRGESGLENAASHASKTSQVPDRSGTSLHQETARVMGPPSAPPLYHRQMGRTSGLGTQLAIVRKQAPNATTAREPRKISNLPKAKEVPEKPKSQGAASDLGPWSREAWDLFDWQPPVDVGVAVG